jgi:hypothetical protein
MKDFFDEFCAKWSDLRDRSSKSFGFILTIIRWILIIVLPVIFGGYGSVVFEKYLKQEISFSIPELLTPQSLHILWPCILLLFLMIIGQVWRFQGTKRVFKERLLYYALCWLYHDLGFENNNEADIRCTIWTPLNSKLPIEKIRLLQLVNYWPAYEKQEKVSHHYRLNKRRGRIRKAARLEEGGVKPIGIIGLNILKSQRDHNGYIIRVTLDKSVSFIDQMIDTWNFTNAEAKRLTQDRLSYMSIALMNSGKTDILGIIFFDSKVPDLFTEQVEENIKVYVPRIAELLTD